MRKGRDGEEKRRRKLTKIKMILVSTYSDMEKVSSSLVVPAEKSSRKA